MKPMHRKALRFVLASLGATVAVLLVKAWGKHATAELTCQATFGPLEGHNGYLEIGILSQHPHEETFQGRLFAYYPAKQRPPQKLGIAREAAGSYARSLYEVDLVPWSRGLATRMPIEIEVPTQGVSSRQFPFGSPILNTQLHLSPPIQPKVVRVRNFSSDFVALCKTLRSDWRPSGELSISIELQRNPFVQYSAVIFGCAALFFGLLLGVIREFEDLAIATASFFFSIWSVRAIVTPPNLQYSTLLDFWLMAVSLLVLFIIAWRLGGGIEPRRAANVGKRGV